MSTHRQIHARLASHHASSFFSGVLIGGLIGSGAALLLAPQSGKKTRTNLEEESIELRDQVVDTAESVFGQARGKARQMARNIRKQTKELKKQGQDMLDEQAEVVSDVVEAEKKAARHIANG